MAVVGAVDAQLHLDLFAVLVVLNGETAARVPVYGEQFGTVVELKLLGGVVLDDPVGENLDGKGWSCLFYDRDGEGIIYKYFKNNSIIATY